MVDPDIASLRAPDFTRPVELTLAQARSFDGNKPTERELESIRRALVYLLTSALPLCGMEVLQEVGLEGPQVEED